MINEFNKKRLERQRREQESTNMLGFLGLFADASNNSAFGSMIEPLVKGVRDFARTIVSLPFMSQILNSVSPQISNFVYGLANLDVGGEKNSKVRSILTAPSAQSRTAAPAVSSAIAAQPSFLDNTLNSISSMFEAKESFNSASQNTTGVSSIVKSALSPADAKKYRVTGDFGEKRGHRIHQGVDYATPIGVKVIGQAGKVAFAGTLQGYGKTVITEHNGFYKLHAHLSSIDVRKGQSIKDGQLIARTGNTGVGTGAHLHMEVISKKDNTVFDYRKALGKDMTNASVLNELKADTHAHVHDHGVANRYKKSGFVAAAVNPSPAA